MNKQYKLVQVIRFVEHFRLIPKRVTTNLNYKNFYNIFSSVYEKLLCILTFKTKNNKLFKKVEVI